MKLHDVKEGAAARVLAVSGGGARFVSRITSVGLTEGCRIEVLQNVRKRPVLVYVRDSAVAIDRGDCELIDVEVVS